MGEKYSELGLASVGSDVVLAVFANQVDYCLANSAPVTARVVGAIGGLLQSGDDSVLLNTIRNWPGAPMADALPLRMAGGVHALYLSGKAPELARIYDAQGEGNLTEDVALLRAVFASHEAALLPWLDGPPQTNEAGRSVNYIAAMHWLAEKGLPAQFECIEIGSSAGINLMIDRYHYDLGGAQSGPVDAPMRFCPDWQGPPPPAARFTFAGLRGCDVAPVDLTDPAQAMRLRAYIWPEHHVRFGRMDAAIALAQQSPPDLVGMNAADFVEQQLALPQAEGTTRVLMHSIVWQYVPADQQERVTAAMAAAGARATVERPLVWIALEANRTVHHHELTVRAWPSGAGIGAEPKLLATAHAHGAWVKWAAE
jgi:hypothetical protein